MFDTIIIGAGFAGAILAERLATQHNKRILVIDKRQHIGGNCYDCYGDVFIAKIFKGWINYRTTVFI